MTVAIETATDRIRAWARECALARQEARDRAETYCAAMLQADLDDAHPYVMEARADLHHFIDTIINSQGV